MATVTKTGFGFWKKTVVEHAGKTDVYKGNAEVEYKDGSVCVTEKSIFASNSSCYIEEKDSERGSNLPDGNLVGKSKSITVETHSSGAKRYESGIFAVNSMEKHGDKVQIVQNGIFGQKVIDTLDARDVGKIESEDCNVCKTVNPIYNK